MKKFYNPFRDFTKFEWILYVCSLVGILLSFFLCKNTQYLYLIASLLGATALIFVAKGHVLGQILTVVFSLFYGYISYSFAYYGELITYLGMTAPIAVAAVITWLKNPYKGEEEKTEVAVNSLSKLEYLLIFLAGIVITVGFYFILKALNTAFLLVSTLSVLTSFLAVYLTARRSPLYAIAYACNDVVLIILWSFASVQTPEYLCMVACFVVFLINDTYGFFQWRNMKKRQSVQLQIENSENKNSAE